MAIVLIGAVVLAASGFVPSGRLAAASGRIRFGLLAAVVALVLVAAPLTDATLASDSHAQTTQAANQAAVTWLAPYPSLTLTGATISGTLVTVDVAGPASPPSTTSLAQALTGVLGPGMAVEVRWFQTTSATDSRGAGTLSLTLAQLQPMVQSWLAGAAGGASTLHIVQLTKSGDTVNVELAGPSAPPPANLLTQAISKRAGQAVTVSVSWRTSSPASAPPASPASDTQKAQAAVTGWLAANPGPEILDVSVTGGVATVDLAGTDPSQVTSGLWTALQAQLGPDVSIVIRFAQLKALTP